MADKPTIYVIAAICGNAWVESTVNAGWNQVHSSVWKDGGIFQWTDNSMGATNYTDWLAWMSDTGYEWNDPEGQLTYFETSKLWNKHTGYMISFDEWYYSDSVDIDYLTAAMYYNFESPGSSDTTLPKRQALALEAYQYILDHYDEEQTWTVEYNSYLTEAEALENCVLIYKYLSEGRPSPGGNMLIYGAAREIIRRLILHA